MNFHANLHTSSFFTSRLPLNSDFIIHVIKNLGQSLQYGNQYIYQSMPLLLTLWFDFGVHVLDLEKGKKTEKTVVAKTMLMRLNKVGDEEVVKYYFYLIWY